MRRHFVRRWSSLFLLGTLILGLAPSRAHAADPQPYEVVLKPTGDADLDAAVHDSAALIDLKDKTAVGGFALVQRARDDKDRFQAAARSFGYYNATVGITIGAQDLDDPALVDAIDKAAAAPPIKVTVSINTGRRFRLGRITISGNAPPAVIASLGLTQGQPAQAAEVLAARDRLLKAAREAGYPLATVTLLPAVPRPDREELDVAFQVETGPRAPLGQISVSGLRDLSEAFMRRQLLLRPGQKFSPTAIEEARQDLMSLGVFSSVQIVPAEQLSPAGDLPLAVNVEERKLHAVDLGAAWSTDLGANLNVGWHHRNLFGEAEQLNLTAAVQLGGNATTKPGEQLGAQFIKPGFLRRDQSLELNLGLLKQSLVAYDQRALIERIGITRKLSPHWSVQVGILAEQERITQEEVGRTYDFVGLPLSVKYDSTKSLLDPVDGMRATLSLTPTYSFSAPGAFYLITQLSGSAYFDLAGNGRSVVAVRGLVGEVTGASVFGVPPDQRLYAGGSGTVRGYRYQSIGPRFADGKPTGGTAVSAGTIELRQRFLVNWGAAAFVDVGQASADARPFSSDWRVGAGAGLRYYTPIGPIRLDVAVPLIRVSGSDSVEVYIGIGQAF